MAKIAIQEFGSIEKYTEAMKHNMEHFSEFMEQWYSKVPEEMKTEKLFLELASLKDEDVCSSRVQNIVHEIIDSAHENAPADVIGSTTSYCQMMIENYSDDYLRAILDAKHGAGYCDYIINAFRCYLENHAPENE